MVFCLVETKEESFQITLQTIDAAPSCTGMQRPGSRRNISVALGGVLALCGDVLAVTEGL